MAKEYDDGKYYSRVAINKTKQVGLNLLFVFSFIVTTVIIFRHIFYNSSWQATVLPMILFNIPLILCPLATTWEYQPWQAKAQKYERHYND